MRINAKHIILRSTRKKPDPLKERVTVGCSRRRPQFAATMSTKPNLKPNPNLTLWTWLGPLWTWLRLQPTLSAKSQASYIIHHHIYQQLPQCVSHTNVHYSEIYIYKPVNQSRQSTFKIYQRNNNNKLCAWRHDMPPPLSSPVGAQAPRAPPSIFSHAEYVPMLTAAAALRVKAALSKAAWWPW